MNIKPTSTENVPQTPLPPTVKGADSGKQTIHQFFVEEFRPERVKQIEEAFKETPEMRPEVIEKAKELIADPNFPSRHQLVKLAKMIVGDRVPVPPTVQPPPIDPPDRMPPMVDPPETKPPVSATDL